MTAVVDGSETARSRQLPTPVAAAAARLAATRGQDILRLCDWAIGTRPGRGVEWMAGASSHGPVLSEGEEPNANLWRVRPPLHRLVEVVPLWL